eukprot:366273-Chlamydomonas_euryale.AAC.5
MGGAGTELQHAKCGGQDRWGVAGQSKYAPAVGRRRDPMLRWSHTPAMGNAVAAGSGIAEHVGLEPFLSV